MWRYPGAGTLHNKPSFPPTTWIWVLFSLVCHTVCYVFCNRFISKMWGYQLSLTIESESGELQKLQEAPHGMWGVHRGWIISQCPQGRSHVLWGPSVEGDIRIFLGLWKPEQWAIWSQQGSSDWEEGGTVLLSQCHTSQLGICHILETLRCSSLEGRWWEGRCTIDVEVHTCWGPGEEKTHMTVQLSVCPLLHACPSCPRIFWSVEKN
jgi:hypothetical protein